MSAPNNIRGLCAALLTALNGSVAYASGGAQQSSPQSPQSPSPVASASVAPPPIQTPALNSSAPIPSPSTIPDFLVEFAGGGHYDLKRDASGLNAHLSLGPTIGQNFWVGGEFLLQQSVQGDYLWGSGGAATFLRAWIWERRLGAGVLGGGVLNTQAGGKPRKLEPYMAIELITLWPTKSTKKASPAGAELNRTRRALSYYQTACIPDNTTPPCIQESTVLRAFANSQPLCPGESNRPKAGTEHLSVDDLTWLELQIACLEDHSDERGWAAPLLGLGLRWAPLPIGNNILQLNFLIDF